MNYNIFPIKENQLLATNTHIGMRLRFRRKELKLTQHSLAKAINISYQQIQKYEKGTNRIGADRLYYLSVLLGVNISYFFIPLNELHLSEKPPKTFAHDKVNSLVMDDINPSVRTALVNLIEVMNKPKHSVN